MVSGVIVHCPPLTFPGQYSIYHHAMPRPPGASGNVFVVQPRCYPVEPQTLGPEGFQPVQRLGFAFLIAVGLPPFASALSGPLPHPGPTEKYYC